MFNAFGLDFNLYKQVRKEGRREKMTMLQSLKDETVKQAQEREETAHMTLEEAVAKLDDQLSKLNMPIAATTNNQPKPCESLRAAVLSCYSDHTSKNVLACTNQVEAFTECAKQLCNVTSN